MLLLSCQVLLAALPESDGVRDGYLCREQECDMRFMVCFRETTRALEWCLLVQVGVCLASGCGVCRVASDVVAACRMPVCSTKTPTPCLQVCLQLWHKEHGSTSKLEASISFDGASGHVLPAWRPVDAVLSCRYSRLTVSPCPLSFVLMTDLLCYAMVWCAVLCYAGGAALYALASGGA